MPIQSIESESHYLVAVASELPAVVFKHSPGCGVSWMALRVIRAFADQHPEVPVLMLDVLAQRDLSDAIAERLGIRHESPQAIVMRAGQAVRSASHLSITVELLAQSAALAAAEL